MTAQLCTTPKGSLPKKGRCKAVFMTLLALAIALLLFTEPATAALTRWTGIRSWSTAGRAATIRGLELEVRGRSASVRFRVA